MLNVLILANSLLPVMSHASSRDFENWVGEYEVIEKVKEYNRPSAYNKVHHSSCRDNLSLYINETPQLNISLRNRETLGRSFYWIHDTEVANREGYPTVITEDSIFQDRIGYTEIAGHEYKTFHMTVSLKREGDIIEFTELNYDENELLNLEKVQVHLICRYRKI